MNGNQKRRSDVMRVASKTPYRPVRKLVALLAAASSIAMAGVANAQTANTPAPEAVPAAAPTGLQDIIVTAQRRSESVRTVPIAIQVLTNATLSRNAINDTTALASISPTVNFQSGFNGGGSAVSLRGITSGAVSAGIQPETLVVVDGVPLARQAEFISELNDIDRIEVLNGPQGTLFGKNSAAGVISIVTKQPTDKFEGQISGTATTDKQYIANATVNVPLSDSIAVRASGFYDKINPLVRNLDPSTPGVDGLESYGGNVKIRFDLAPTVKLTVAGTYIHRFSSFGQSLLIHPGLQGAAENAILGYVPGRGQDFVNTDAPAKNVVTSKNIAATLAWQATDKLTITSISSATKFYENAVIDVDATPAGVNIGTGYTPVLSKVVGVDAGYHVPDHTTYYSEELRGNYHSGALNAVAGLFYQHLKTHYTTDAPFLIDGAFLKATPGQLYFSNQSTNNILNDSTASVFGDATYSLTDHLKAFAGLRFTHERLAVNYTNAKYFNPLVSATGASLFDPITAMTLAPPIATYAVNAEKTVNNLSGRAGLQYQPSTNVNLYASYARGYKAPGVDLSPSVPTGANPIVAAETANAFEVGAKIRAFDNRASLNVAVFYETINNIQEQVSVAAVAAIINQLVNAGKLKTRGVALDGEFLVAKGLRLSGGVAYVKATYGDYPYLCTTTQTAAGTCPNYTHAGFQNIAGQQAIGSPNWKYSLTGDYETPLGSSQLTFFSHVNWTWNSLTQYGLGADPLRREPSHGLLDASIGIDGADKRWSLQLFGKNLTNKFYYTNLNNSALIGAPFADLPRDFHRYGGVKLTYNW